MSILLSMLNIDALCEKSSYVDALRRHGQCDCEIYIPIVTLPCCSKEQITTFQIAIEVLSDYRPAYSLHSLDPSDLFQCALFLQCPFLEHYIRTEMININTCVPLLVKCLNTVGPNDETVRDILFFMNERLGLPDERIFEAVLNTNPCSKQVYVAHSLTNVVRQFKKKMDRFWCHYPSAIQCVYCNAIIRRYSAFCGPLATICTAHCCRCLVHISCLTKTCSAAYPRCKKCKSPLLPDGHVDFELDNIGWAIDRNTMRREYAVAHVHLCERE